MFLCRCNLMWTLLFGEKQCTDETLFRYVWGGDDFIGRLPLKSNVPMKRRASVLRKLPVSSATSPQISISRWHRVVKEVACSRCHRQPHFRRWFADEKSFQDFGEELFSSATSSSLAILRWNGGPASLWTAGFIGDLSPDINLPMTSRCEGSCVQ